MQALFVRLLHGEPPKEVAVQLLQTANLLVHNLVSYQAKTVLICMKMYEEFIAYPFVLLDNELCENYVSLLKGISVNLPGDLLLGYLITREFNLFNKARVFCFYQEPMVRIASQSILLKIVRLQHPLVRDYVLSSGFVLSVVVRARESVYEISRMLDERTPVGRVSTVTRKVVDILYYMNDIFMGGVKEISDQLHAEIVCHLAPLLLESVYSERGELSRVGSSTGMFMLIQMLRILKCSRTVDWVLKKLFGNREVIDNEENCNEEFENPLFLRLLQFLEFKQEPLVTLTLLLIYSIQSSGSISRNALAAMSINSREDSKLIGSLTRLLEPAIYFKEATSNLVVNILAFVTTPGNTSNEILIENLTGIIKQKLIKLEHMMNSQLFDASCLDLFEQEWDKVSALKFNENIECNFSFLLPNDYEMPQKVPLSQRSPKGSGEKAQSKIYQILLLLRFRHYLEHPGVGTVPPVIFSSVQSCQRRRKFEYEMELNAQLFKQLFTKITHKSDFTNVSIMDGITAQHFFIPNRDYSRIALIFEGISNSDETNQSSIWSSDVYET